MSQHTAQPIVQPLGMVVRATSRRPAVVEFSCCGRNRSESIQLAGAGDAAGNAGGWRSGGG